MKNSISSYKKRIRYVIRHIQNPDNKISLDELKINIVEYLCETKDEVKLIFDLIMKYSNKEYHNEYYCEELDDKGISIGYVNILDEKQIE